MIDLPQSILQNIELTKEEDKIAACNSYTKKFGITLSKEEITNLLTERFETLNKLGRIELGGGVLDQLIFEFCDSAYIWQENYALTISQLQEIFYYFKNESLEEFTDIELIHMMKQYFEGECQGSFEYLQETKLEDLCRTIRESHDEYEKFDSEKEDYLKPWNEIYGYYGEDED